MESIAVSLKRPPPLHAAGPPLSFPTVTETRKTRVVVGMSGGEWIPRRRRRRCCSKQGYDVAGITPEALAAGLRQSRAEDKRQAAGGDGCPERLA